MRRNAERSNPNARGMSELVGASSLQHNATLKDAMQRTTIAARSIAAPLWASLQHSTCHGRVLSVHNRSCNLLINHRIINYRAVNHSDAPTVITIAEAVIGNGPFTIVVDETGPFLQALTSGETVEICQQCLSISAFDIVLSDAEIWQPRLPDQIVVGRTSSTLQLLRPYAEWPHLGLEDGSIGTTKQVTVRALRSAADALCASLAQDDKSALTEAATSLTGLGSGLTPAGDDYLLGCMAALWLCGRRHFLPQIDEAIRGRTTILSEAFLRAAARGLFTEPWHRLAHALLIEDLRSVAQSLDELAKIGASSGLDALAGFAATCALMAEKSRR